MPLSEGGGTKRHEKLHQCGKEAHPLCSGKLNWLTTAEELVKFANRLWLGRRLGSKTQRDISQRFCDDWRSLYDTNPPVRDDGCPEDFLMNSAYSCPNPPLWLAELLAKTNSALPAPLVPQPAAIDSTPHPGNVANALAVYSASSSSTYPGTSSVVHRQHNISGSEWCFITKAPCYVNQGVSWVGPVSGNPERRANVVRITLPCFIQAQPHFFPSSRSVFFVIRV